ncbi:DNA repair protein rhp7 [Cyphellophora attinorum]|uniref:DNA repair protein rhp7 n=1 Tax=Cyphellophora attinorum TaxID=1664694 RepID=A0A0N1HI55_9EURO|nr:DNA repair protein rhp7 [Phialophora attinorum]KPI45910.1 DNA repair protein rhp7 [Phialophora attinorum]
MLTAHRSRRNAAANANNRIRGPQSALTEFLAAQGISAADIHNDYLRRQREAEQAAAAEEAQANKENESDDDGEDTVELKKRKRKEEKALNKIKQTKEFKKRKFEEQRDNGSDADDDDTIARQMMAKNKPLPGQLENCEICEKRFTVTPYSKSGPDGGLLCVKCSKELKDEEKKAQKVDKKKAPQRGRKRQTESDRMMGDVKPGAKSLIDACVRKVADVVHDIDDFGDMPDTLLDRLSQILSKKRVMSPRVLNLFLRDDVDHIDVYDCAKLETEDFERIFAHMPHLVSVNLRFAGQMKDGALLYMADKCHSLRHLQLGATNLITDMAWTEFFKARGHQLESLKVSEVQEMFSDGIVLQIVQQCTNLKRLKLRGCSHLTDISVAALSHLTKLEHLTIAIAQHLTTPDQLISLISKLGPNLKTLCLEGYDHEPERTEEEEEEGVNFHDPILDTIQQDCTQLRKLRITGGSHYTDRVFAELFTGWANPPLTHVDLSDNRWIDNNDARGPVDEPVGFSSQAFKALMQHSGSQLQQLNLHSCRHISHEALLDVFDGQKRYPELRNIDLSFVTHLDDVVMNGIFRSCPSLTKLTVFACFKARGAEIPQGVAVIGLPNATENIVIQGFMDELLAKALA